MGFTVESILPLAELKRRYLAWVLEQTGQNKSEAARQMRIDRASLSRMLRRRSRVEPSAERPEPGAPRPADGEPRDAEPWEPSQACHCSEYLSSGIPCPPGTCPNNPHRRSQ
jgi:hypothetical protein